MKTVPAKFARAQMRTSEMRRKIVKIVKGSTTWIFSDTEMELTDGHVYACMANSVRTSESINYKTKKWSVSDTRIDLLNVDYDRSGLKVADRFADLRGADVYLYLNAGPLSRTDGLDDCLLYFYGRVMEPIKYDVNKVSITATDYGVVTGIMLPPTVIDGNLAGPLPEEKKTGYVPIVYGKFIKGFDLTVDTGLAVAPVSDWVSEYPKVVVSDHALHAIDGMFAEVSQLPEPIEYLNPTLSTADSGMGSAVALDNTARVFLYPTGNFVGDTSENSTGTLSVSSENGAIDSASSQDAGATVRFQTTIYPLGMSFGQYVTISGTTSYNGQYIISGIQPASGWFEIEETFVADESGSFTADVAQGTTNALNASDQDDSTYATITERIDSGTDLYAQGLFSLDNYATGDNLENRLGKITSMTAEVKISTAAGVTFDGTGAELSMIWGAESYERTALANLSNITGTVFNAIGLDIGSGEQVITLDGTSTANGGDSKLPVVGHSLSTSDAVHITGTDNYDGSTTVISHDANTVTVDITHVAETFDRNARIEKQPNMANRIAWHMLNGHKLIQAGDKEYPLVFMISVTTGTNTPVGDDIPNNQEVLRVHEFRIKTDFDLVSKPRKYFASCEGLEYPAWIDGRGSAHSSGAVIEQPEHIIESILRDWIGVSASFIDEQSFIDAEDSNYVMSLNLHTDNRKRSDDVIREISEQSSFCFHWSGASKARLISLANTTPTTAQRFGHPVRIPWSHIDPKKFKLGYYPTIINSVHWKARYMNEYGIYRDQGTSTSSSSITEFDEVFEYEAQWPNISGTTITNHLDHLLGTNGIWSEGHELVRFETGGFIYADIEIGDWIEFDAASMDYHILSRGTSWSGKQFLVVGVRLKNDSIEFDAVKLF